MAWMLLASAAAADPPVAPVAPGEPKLTSEADLWNAGIADILRPYMSPGDFAALGARLRLDAAQSAGAEAMHRAYDGRMQEIRDALLRQVVTPLLAYIRAAEAGQALPRDQASATVRLVAGMFRRHEPAARQALAALLDELQSSLSEAQRLEFPAAVRAWRRSVMLNPAGEGCGFDLSIHADLFSVVASACRGEPALRPLLDRCAEPLVESAAAEARKRCLEILAAYEIELDRLVETQYRRAADDFFDGLQASTDGDLQAAERRLQGSRREWMKVFRTTTSAAEAMATALEEGAGPLAARAWRDAYHAAYYPVLHGRKSTDYAHDWLLQEADLSPAQQAAVREIYEQYAERRRGLEARARALPLQLADDLNLSAPGQFPAYVAAGGPVPPAKIELDAQRRALCEQANRQFREILADPKRPAFDVMLARLDRASRKFEF
jgi:hypothetical protein